MRGWLASVTARMNWSGLPLGFAAVAVALWVLQPSSVQATTINFEGFPDSTILTTQYPGLTFTNTIILTAGISLNEFEFPPHSGVNVASDNGGPITIDFATPVATFSGFFTYSVPLSLDAFNAGSMLVASASSLFSNNEALSGDSGSSPNELLQVSFSSGISSVEILGDPAGSSFTMDDVTYMPVSSSVPEPGSLILLLSGGAVISALRRGFSGDRAS